jgi:propionyl-CoA carboxylase alpha chain
VRGFLPSTGRLVTYRPPPQELQAAHPTFGSAEASAEMPSDGIRVDSGVYEGGEIPIHYDSMICKLIAHGRDRADAIARLRDALDAFVIRGVASNIPFQATLLAHSRFVSGRFNTGFITEEYPKGWAPLAAPDDDRDFLLVLAVAVHRRLLDRAAGISGQLPGHEMRIGEAFVVVVADAEGARMQTPVTAKPRNGDIEVVLCGRTRRVTLEGPLRYTVVHGACDGRPFRAQVERVGLGYRLSHRGAQLEARVLSPRAAELYALMPVQTRPDLSKFLLSPMPGLLVDVAVQPGQAVRAGERLAVIEAMKMENILVATQDSVVAKLTASPGETLAVDQVILEFE